jgi:hypothetical protein
MPLFDDPPLHDFPDRAIRRLQADPANLRNLMAAVLPDLFERDRADAVARPALVCAVVGSEAASRG